MNEFKRSNLKHGDDRTNEGVSRIVNHILRTIDNNCMDEAMLRRYYGASMAYFAAFARENGCLSEEVQAQLEDAIKAAYSTRRRVDEEELGEMPYSIRAALLAALPDLKVYYMEDKMFDHTVKACWLLVDDIDGVAGYGDTAHGWIPANEAVLERRGFVRWSDELTDAHVLALELGAVTRLYI